MNHVSGKRISGARTAQYAQLQSSDAGLFANKRLAFIENGRVIQHWDTAAKGKLPSATRQGPLGL